MHNMRYLAAVCILIGGSAASSAADPVTVTGDLRLGAIQLFASDSAGSDSQQRTVAETGPIAVSGEISRPSSHAAAFATVIGDFADPLHFAGEGAASAIGGTDSLESTADALSRFGVEFTTTQPLAFDLAALFALNGDGGWTHQVSFLDAVTGGLVTTIPSIPTNIRVKGLLQPGSYIFAVIGRANAVGLPGSPFSSSVSYTYSLDFSSPAATPEPATLVLIGSGLAAAMCRRRRVTS